MLRGIALSLALLAALAQGAIWPESFAGLQRKSVKPVTVTDKEVWDEYGFEEAEAAEYVSGASRFEATAWRLKDPTAAMAVYQWQRPADATQSELGRLAAETPSSALVVFGNYLFRFDGRKPSVQELAPLIHGLPRLDQSPLPVLSDYLPTRELVPNSERYVLGPESLARFAPRIPPSVAAFHFGTEVQIGTFRTSSGDMTLAIFSYPTPHIARERLNAFAALPGAVVKRSGPLVAVILSPPNADAAERLLARVNYKVSLAWNEYKPGRRENVGDLILNIFILTGIILAFATLSGLAFGGLRVLLRRARGKAATDDPMIMLHLERKEDRRPSLPVA